MANNNDPKLTLAEQIEQEWNRNVPEVAERQSDEMESYIATTRRIHASLYDDESALVIQIAQAEKALSIHRENLTDTRDKRISLEVVLNNLTGNQADDGEVDRNPDYSTISPLVTRCPLHFPDKCWCD